MIVDYFLIRIKYVDCVIQSIQSSIIEVIWKVASVNFCSCSKIHQYLYCIKYEKRGTKKFVFSITPSMFMQMTFFIFEIFCSTLKILCNNFFKNFQLFEVKYSEVLTFCILLSIFVVIFDIIFPPSRRVGSRPLDKIAQIFDFKPLK